MPNQAETVDGRQIEIHENPSGHRRYWVKVGQHALLQGGSLRVRLFTTAEAAQAAALKESETLPGADQEQADQRKRERGRRKARADRKALAGATVPDGVPGYSNFGGGGPFAPMGAPQRSPKRRST